MKNALMPAVVDDQTRQPGEAIVRTDRLKPRSDAARELLLQAKAASLQNLRALQRAVRETRERAQTIGTGGDLYPWPLEDFARRLGEDLLWREKTLQLLIERQQKFSALPRDIAA